LSASSSSSSSRGSISAAAPVSYNVVSVVDLSPTVIDQSWQRGHEWTVTGRGVTR